VQVISSDYGAVVESSAAGSAANVEQSSKAARAVVVAGADGWRLDAAAEHVADIADLPDDASDLIRVALEREGEWRSGWIVLWWREPPSGGGEAGWSAQCARSSPALEELVRSVSHRWAVCRVIDLSAALE
jgi:hypothetical protein